MTDGPKTFEDLPNDLPCEPDTQHPTDQEVFLRTMASIEAEGFGKPTGNGKADCGTGCGTANKCGNRCSR